MATINNIAVKRQIAKNGAPDIGIASYDSSHTIGLYNKYYDAHLSSGDVLAARDAIGSVCGHYEYTGNMN